MGNVVRLPRTPPSRIVLLQDLIGLVFQTQHQAILNQTRFVLPATYSFQKSLLSPSLSSAMSPTPVCANVTNVSTSAYRVYDKLFEHGLLSYWCNSCSVCYSMNEQHLVLPAYISMLDWCDEYNATWLCGVQVILVASQTCISQQQ
jgi:hypothetical protein